MHIEKASIAVTTAADGSATAYSPPFTGAVLDIVYVKSTFSDGVDFDLDLLATGQVLWNEDNVNASASIRPRTGVHDNGRNELTYDNVNPLVEPIYAALDKLRIVIAQGGNVKSGTFILIIDGTFHGPS